MKLKKLEWQKNIEGDYEADAFHGRYIVCRFGGDFFLTFDKTGINFYTTLEKAMDAAQLDFERMVCECYEYPEQAEAAHE